MKIIFKFVIKLIQKEGNYSDQMGNLFDPNYAHKKERAVGVKKGNQMSNMAVNLKCNFVYEQT